MNHSIAIYTMKAKKDLRKAFESKEEATFVEKRRWITGYNEFKKAVKDKISMLIFFSYAEEQSGVVYMGRLTKIEIDDETTRYSFVMLKSFNNPKDLSALILNNGNKPLSDNYIRPYAIVKLPNDIDNWH